MTLKLMLKRFINKLIPDDIKISGKNNNIKISQSSYRRKFSLKIYGNNNTVEIGDNSYLHNVKNKNWFSRLSDRKLPCKNRSKNKF